MHLRTRFAAFFLAIPAFACGFAPHAILAQEAVVAPASQPAAESWTLIDDDWRIMELAGARVGWTNMRVEQSGNQFRTVDITDMSVNRGVDATHIHIETSVTETADGKPLRMQLVQDMSQQKVKTTWEFAADGVNEISEKGGRQTMQHRPMPEGEWLTPHKADEYARQQREAGAKEITFRSISPENGITPFSTTTKRAGTKEFEVAGKAKSVDVWRTTTEILPLEVMEYYDAGDLVYEEIPMGLGKIVMRAASKAQAMAKIDGAGPELLERSFITPDKPIANVIKASKAKLKLVARQGTLPDLPDAGSQRVEMSADHKAAILTIDINDELPASEAERADEEYVKPSAVVDFDDEVVNKLSDRAKARDDAMSRAEALRALVGKRISKKSMATVFASASETARTQTGDCSEHGVLLAALLRAQHIPARVAMGLVYAEEFMGEKGIFGWHMWTQALIDGKWVDLDATLPVRYHAAHVLTNTSSLADGLGAADMVSIMQLIGNVDIEVLEVEHAAE